MRILLLGASIVCSTGWLAACGGNPPAPPADPPAASAPGVPPATDAGEPSRILEIPADVLRSAPRPTRAERGELFDVSRDLEDLAARDAEAAANLVTDLQRFAPSGVEADLRAFVNALAPELADRSLAREHSMRLAALLYVAMNADALSDDERASLVRDVDAAFGAVGVSGSGARLAPLLSRIVAAGGQ